MLKGEGCPYTKTERRLAQKQPPFKKCVTAYSSSVWVPKMDGAKMTTDTADNQTICGKQAYQLGRSMYKNMCGPIGNENPSNSRTIVV